MPGQSWSDKQQAILEDFKSGRHDDETTIRRLRAIGMAPADAAELVKDISDASNG